MAEPVIAIIFDFDDTLGPDTISFLLEKYNIKPEGFWKEIDDRVYNGWDPPQAYMNRILEHVREGKIKDLTKQKLQDLGGKLPLFPGLPNAFDEVNKYTWRIKKLREGGIKLEFYIITGGLEEIIRGTAIAGYMNGIFGCNFDYDPSTNLPCDIKSVISFTEKTRFVFAINKGISEEIARANPYIVNTAMPDNERRIPFANMIYIGDGPSDIPCLSLIRKNKGEVIGVCPPAKRFKRGYELARGRRITIGPYSANYERDSDMRKALEEAILARGLDILVEKRKHWVEPPSQ